MHIIPIVQLTASFQILAYHIVAWYSLVLQSSFCTLTHWHHLGDVAVHHCGND